MKCPVCKGKKGKTVTEYHQMVWNHNYTVFQHCKNCNGNGVVGDEVNHTPYTLETIKGFCFLMMLDNKWRQRKVSVYQHPLFHDRVITVGVPFDGGGAIICDENKSLWPRLESPEYQDGCRHFVYN